MSVILKKDEKVASVLNALPDNYSQNDFISKFKEMYSSDWSKLVKSYNEHIKDAKPGKIIPMPKPEQYLINALNVWNKKQS